MGLRPLQIFFQCVDRIDLYRRQILTYKDSPHTERVRFSIIFLYHASFVSNTDIQLIRTVNGLKLHKYRISPRIVRCHV